jgi:hypothetical protein
MRMRDEHENDDDDDDDDDEAVEGMLSSTLTCADVCKILACIKSFE